MPAVNLPEILKAEPQPPEWIVDRFIPRDTITVLVGLEGIGKSSLSYALALAVSAGQPFLGRVTTQAKVLYFDNENSLPDCGEYLRQLWIGAGCPNVDTLAEHLRIEHFSLGSGWQGAFKRACVEWQPGLIVIDTANACFSIKDENSNAEAAEIIGFIHTARPPKASVLLMKHEREPKEGQGKSVRGAKYWLGAVDQVVYLHRQVGRPPTSATNEVLHKTKLIPAKHRAYGLDEPILIAPEKYLTPLGKSLIFRHQYVPPS